MKVGDNTNTWRGEDGCSQLTHDKYCTGYV